MFAILAIILLICLFGGALIGLAKWALIAFVLGAAFSAGAHFVQKHNHRPNY